MNQYPLISVIVPIYNTAKFLDASIGSIITQRYPNLEIILLNNGSTDNSEIIMKQYAECDPRIKCYTIKHVDTPKESRDNAIVHASGEWIIPIDSDDMVEDDYVDKLWKRHVETNADFVAPNMIFRSEDKNIAFTIPNGSFDFSQILSGSEAMLRTLNDWNFGANGALMRKSICTNLSTSKVSNIYTDECDTRIHLHNSKLVSFCDARYYVSYNPNSTGRKKSITSLTYQLITYLGLKNFFEYTYGKHSALAMASELIICQEFERVITQIIYHWSLYSGNISERTVRYIINAYSIYRNHNRQQNYFKIQYCRLLLFVLRMKTNNL